MIFVSEHPADKRAMLINVTLEISPQERAFVPSHAIGCLHHNRQRKFGIERHRRGGYNLVDNLIGKLLQHPYGQDDIIATCGMAFVYFVFTHGRLLLVRPQIGRILANR